MSEHAPVSLRFDAFELDERNVRLTRDREPVDLTPKAFGVLCELARHRGDLVSKDALLDAVWGHQHVSESVLKTIISQLRAALSDDARQPRYIETVSRFGYRFIGVAARLPSPLPAADCSPPTPRTPSMVGRVAALDRLRACWHRTLAGERQLVWVVGDAGVGKTTLIESFVSELPPDATVYGRCVEHFGAGEPYLPLLEALNEHCRREPALADVLRSVAPTWLVQMPWLISEENRQSLHRELAGAHPDRMVRELAELMKRYAANRPLLLVIEDLHWSDLGTLRMMEHFARQPRNFGFMWVASFRLTQIFTDDHPLRELRQELKLHRLCDEILLDSFSEGEVGAYLNTRLPDTRFPEDFVRRLHAHTDGLPLFVASVTDSLLTRANVGSSDEDDLNESVSNLPLPESLAGVLDRQATRLPVDTRTLLEAAGACGSEFRANMVAALLDRDDAWVREQCDDLVRRSLWLQHIAFVDLPDGGFDVRYGFVHALYRQYFYQHIPATLRVHYHRAAARWLRQAQQPGQLLAAAEIATHLENGREMVAAMRAYADGAGMALRHFAPKDAANLAGRALALLDHARDGAERDELELALMAHSGVAASLLHGVGSDEALVPFRRVRELCDRLPPHPRRAMALNGLGWVYFTRGEFDNALALSQRLLDISADHDDPALFVYGCNLSGVTNVWKGNLEAACDALRQGLDRCLGDGDRLPLESFVIDPEVSMRGNIAVPLADRGLLDQSLEHLRLARERAERIGQPIACMLAHWATCQVYLRLGDHERVAVHAARIGELVESAMLAHGEGPSLWMRGWADACRGKPRDGYRDILDGFARHTRLGMYAGCTEVLGMAVETLIMDGDRAGAAKQLDEAFALAERFDERLALPQLYLFRSRIAAADGDAGTAEAALRAGLREARSQGADDVELRLLVALFDLGIGRPSDSERLADACRLRREGLDTATFRRATALAAARR